MDITCLWDSTSAGLTATVVRSDHSGTVAFVEADTLFQAC